LRERLDNSFILIVAADPEPKDALTGVDTENAKMRADTRRPIAANPLEVKGWVSRI